MKTPHTPEQTKKLLGWLDRTARLETKTNRQLAVFLEEDVWAELPLGSYTSDLIAEVIARLNAAEEPPYGP